MFYCYFVINAYFMGDFETGEKYAKHLDVRVTSSIFFLAKIIHIPFLQKLLVHTSHGIRLVPELYSVPQALIDDELASPGSQEFEASGRIPFMWAQSLYVIRYVHSFDKRTSVCWKITIPFSQLLKDSFIACGELDPINRRLSSLKRPEVVVQVVVLAKDDRIKEILQQSGYQTKTLKEVTNIEGFY